jgi:NAD(P)-dependent dehydrogenase (short-subunit alcohol dehydrogenase family)
VAKVALVTGASAGIGRAAADRLAGAGWTVLGASRRGTAGAGWEGVVADVDDDTSVRSCLDSLLAAHGRVDALVLAAGWGLAGAVEHTPMADARAQFETNFWGCVRVVQAALPAMRAQGSGRIVLVGSLLGLIGVPFQAFYAATKFALEGYGESLAYEVAPFGIHVTILEPGNIRTEFTASRRDVEAGGDDPYAAAVAKAVGRMEKDEAGGADPERVAAAVERVLAARRPPRRLPVGKLEERAGVFAKRLLPFRAFEAAAKPSLGL